MRAHNLISKTKLGVNMEGYSYHYGVARMAFINWYYDGHTDKELAELWHSDLYSIDDMLMYDNEFKHALEAFDEAEQVKILYHYERGDHCLKIKWEVNPWWPGQVLHFYYCIMLPIDQVNFTTPYKLFTGEEE